MAVKMKKVTPLPKLLATAQKIVNAYVRKRDEDLPCISCGRVHDAYDAGHYVPVGHGKGSYLRFHEWNVHKEGKSCNAFDEFHLIGYRKRLIDKIGLEAVEWLEENRNVVKKWTRQELYEIIEKYGK